MELIRMWLAMGLAVLLCGADRHESRAVAGQTGPLVAEPCSQSWAEAVGRDVVQDVWAYSADPRQEFVDWLLAVAWVESHMDPAARSSAGAVGLLQLTPQGALEASMECGLPPLASRSELNELLDRRRSIVYGSCLLKRYLSESGGNWAEALMLYNGGYRQVANYLGRRALARETQDYVRDVFYIRYACGPLGRGGHQ